MHNHQLNLKHVLSVNLKDNNVHNRIESEPGNRKLIKTRTIAMATISYI